MRTPRWDAVGRGERGSAFGASEKPLSGVGEDAPSPLQTLGISGWVGWAVGLSCVQERKQAWKGEKNIRKVTGLAGQSELGLRSRSTWS